MKKQNVGIYLGEKVVSGVLTEGNKIIAVATHYAHSLEEQGQRNIVNDGVVWEALINKTLRDIHGAVEMVKVSLADKDFIVRSFEMPLMSRKEIESSIGFEVERYLPFKMGELIWDFSFSRVPGVKKIHVSFLGIRKNVYAKYINLFTHLNLKVISLEPAFLSMVRMLKRIKEYKKVKNFALLDITKKESYITFFNNDLPVFNRYLTNISTEDDFTADKLYEEIRISIQYFKREFGDYGFETLLIFGDYKDFPDIDEFSKDLDLSVSIVSPEKIVDYSNVTMGEAKAYGVAVSSMYPNKFMPILKDASEKQKALKDVFLEVPFNLPLLGAITGIGLVICIILQTIFSQNISVEKMRIKKLEEENMISEEYRDKNLSELETVLASEEAELNSTKKIIDSHKKVSTLLEHIPHLLPDGLWLTGMDFNIVANKFVLEMPGKVLLGDPDRETEALNNFVIALRESVEIKKMFSEVFLLREERVSSDDYELLEFFIRLE